MKGLILVLLMGVALTAGCGGQTPEAAGESVPRVEALPDTASGG